MGMAFCGWGIGDLCAGVDSSFVWLSREREVSLSFNGEDEGLEQILEGVGGVDFRRKDEVVWMSEKGERVTRRWVSKVRSSFRRETALSYYFRGVLPTTDRTPTITPQRPVSAVINGTHVNHASRRNFFSARTAARSSFSDFRVR